MDFRISGTVRNSIVDGLGIRYVIFTQGCLHHCKGCHNPQTWDLDKGMLINADVIIEEILKDKLLKGVTFSGGEPFLQVKPLVYISKIMHENNLDVWSYSGFTFEQILNDPIKKELLDNIDCLVDGPFIIEQKGNFVFKGSENQRIIDVKKSLKENKVILKNIEE